MKAKVSPGRVQICVRQKQFKVFTPSAAHFCTEILRALNQENTHLTVTFLTAKQMQDLNCRFRGKDSPTDVLTFCYEDESIEGVPFHGEIVVAPQVAYQQAQRWKIDPERELRKVLLHGLLHLLGYDHEVDDGAMEQLQRKLLRRRVFIDAAPIAEMGHK